MTVTVNEINHPKDVSAINQNFQLLEDYINQYLLNRGGDVSDGNQMSNPLDMNNQPVINVNVQMDNDNSLVNKKYVDDQDAATLISANQFTSNTAQSTIQTANNYTDQVATSKLTIGDSTALYSMLYAGEGIEILDLGNQLAISASVDGTVKTVNLKLPDVNGNVTITAEDLGLGNVDNTADLDKQISTLTAAALNNKVDKSPLDNKFYVLQNGSIVEFNPSSSSTPYLGNWDASTNTPTISDATGSEGEWYICTVPGTVDLGSGAVAYSNLDIVFHDNGTFKVIGTFGGAGSAGIQDTTGVNPKARIEDSWVETTDAQPFIQIVTAPTTPVEGVATTYTCIFHDKETGESFPDNISWKDFNGTTIGTGASASLTFDTQGSQNLTCEYSVTDSYGRALVATDVVVIDVQEAPGFTAVISSPNTVEEVDTFTVSVRDDDLAQATTSVTVTLNNVTKALTQNYVLSRLNSTTFQGTIDLTTSTVAADPGNNVQVEYLDPKDADNQASLITKTINIVPEGGANGVITQEQLQDPTSGTFSVRVADDLPVSTLDVQVVRGGTVVEIDTITLTQDTPDDTYSGSILTQNNASNVDSDGTINILDGDVIVCSYTDTLDFEGTSRVIVQSSYVGTTTPLKDLNWDIWSLNMSVGHNRGVVSNDPTDVVPNFSKVRWEDLDGSPPYNGPLMWAASEIPEGRTCYKVAWSDITGTVELFAGVGYSTGTASSYRSGSALDTVVGNYCALVNSSIYKPEAFITVKKVGSNYDVQVIGKTLATSAETVLATHSFTTTRKVYVKAKQLYIGQLGGSLDHYTEITSDVSKIDYTIPVGYTSSFYPDIYAVTKSEADTGDLFFHDYTNSSEISFNLVPTGKTKSAPGQTNIIASGSIPIPFGVAFDADLSNIVITDDLDNELTSHIAPRFRWVDFSGTRDWNNSLRNIEFWVQVDVNGADSIPLKIKFNQARTLELGAQPVIGSDWTSVNDPATENPSQWPSSYSLTEPKFFVTFTTDYLQSCYLNYQRSGTTSKLRPEYQSYIEDQYYKDAEALEWVDYPERMQSWFLNSANSAQADERRGIWLYQVSLFFLKIYCETGDVRWARALHRMSFAYLTYLNSYGYHNAAQVGDLKYSYVETLSVMGLLFGYEDAKLKPAYENTLNYLTDQYNTMYRDGDQANKVCTERNTVYQLKAYLEKQSLTGYSKTETAKVYGYISRWEEQMNSVGIEGWLQNGGILHSGNSSADKYVKVGDAVASPWQIILQMNTLQKAFILTRDKRCLRMMSRLGDFLIRFGIQTNLSAPFLFGVNRTIALNYYYVRSNVGLHEDSFTDPYDGDAIHSINMIGSLIKSAYAKSLLGEPTDSILTSTELSQLYDAAFEFRYQDFLLSRYQSRLDNVEEVRPAWEIRSNARSVALYTVEAQDLFFLENRVTKELTISDKAEVVTDRSLKVEFESSVSFSVLNDAVSTTDYLQQGATVTLLTPGAKGSVGIVGYDVTYTANSTQTGVDSFVLRVTGQGGVTADIPVDIEIYPSANAPFVSSVSIDVAVDRAITIDLSSYVAGGVGGADNATALIESSVSNGTLDTTNLTTTLQVIYTPNAAYTGPDSFSWSIEDNDSPKNKSNAGVVSLNVTSANLPLVEVNNNPVQAEVGVRKVLTTTDYLYESLNNDPVEIVATIDAVSPDVEIYKSNVLVGNGGTFTMQDVLDGIVEYEGVNVVPTWTTQITVRDTGSPQNQLPGNLGGDSISPGVLWSDDFTTNYAGNATGPLVTNDIVTYPNAQWVVRRDGGTTVVPNIQITTAPDQCLGDADQFGSERVAVSGTATDKSYEVDMTTIDLSTSSSTNHYFSCGVFINNTDTGWPANSETTFRRVTYTPLSASNWLRIFDGTPGQTPSELCNVVANTFDVAKYTLTRDPRFGTEPTVLRDELVNSQLWFRKKAQGIEMYYDNGLGSGKTLLFSLDNIVSGGAEFSSAFSRFWFDWYPNSYTLDSIQCNEVV